LSRLNSKRRAKLSGTPCEVAAHHDQIDAALCDIVEDGIERGEVAVDVVNRRYAHVLAAGRAAILRTPGCLMEQRGLISEKPARKHRNRAVGRTSS
jgi:hypothetical protein